MRSRKNKYNKYLYVGLALTIGLVLVALAYVLIHRSKPKVSPVPVATINQLPANPAANNGEKKLESNTGSGDGYANDNNGQPSSSITSNPSQWLTSESGLVTVKQPTTNSKIWSGFEVIGSAKVSKLHYRLIDNQSGVISQGYISVVNGTFSANINFKSSGSSGRLDIFTIDDNGVESNEVQVGVNF